MNGLRSRLESISGVEGIELELGTDGLEGITVRLSEGADELDVLEEVRRLLVAYGTRSSRVLATSGAGVGPANGSLEPVESRHEVIDLDETPSEMLNATPVTLVSSGETSAAMLTPAGERVELSVTPAGDRSVAKVVYTRGERAVSRQVPSSARAIVQAALDVAAETGGHEPISVIGMNLSAIEGMRVLTVIAGNEGSMPKVSTVSVVESNWPAALLEVSAQILEERPDDL
ncbi:MAG TPA: hypothetical protein VHL52_10405 [Acidimicrobiia bacterium]|nr:hypothetical protein [Acidimicrobiia bacterium]